MGKVLALYDSASGTRSYGRGALVPAHILEYPDQGTKAVQNDHRMLTSDREPVAKEA